MISNSIFSLICRWSTTFSIAKNHMFEYPLISQYFLKINTMWFYTLFHFLHILSSLSSCVVFFHYFALFFFSSCGTTKIFFFSHECINPYFDVPKINVLVWVLRELRRARASERDKKAWNFTHKYFPRIVIKIICLH